MAIQEVLSDVQERLETAGEQAQSVAETVLEQGKKAIEVVVDGVQALVKAQTAAAKDLVAEAKETFNKAKTAGFKAVAEKPADYLPSTERAVAAFNEGKDLVIKAGEELVAVVKKGAKEIKAEITGKPVRKPAAKRSTGARKTTVAKAA
ncbi:MAG: phasin family protein [Acidobacteria bacterium]|nr:phasin family protein [Acidobacteriota bacterium]